MLPGSIAKFGSVFLFCFCLFSSSFCSFLFGILSLTAFQNGICHGGGDQADCADCVVVCGDDVINFIRIAVGINDSNDGDVQRSAASSSL